MPTEPLDELRTIIDSLPETAEKLSHGSPTWWGGKRTVATYHAGAYDQGRRAVWIKAPDPQRFYRPKYLGPSGWVGVRLEGRVNWAEIRVLLVQGYRLVAPKRALAILDAGS